MKRKCNKKKNVTGAGAGSGELLRKIFRKMYRMRVFWHHSGKRVCFEILRTFPVIFPSA